MTSRELTGLRTVIRSAVMRYNGNKVPLDYHRIDIIHNLIVNLGYVSLVEYSDVYETRITEWGMRSRNSRGNACGKYIPLYREGEILP